MEIIGQVYLILLSEVLWSVPKMKNTNTLRDATAFPAPIPDRFRHMRGKNIGAARKIGDGPRHSQDAMHRTRRELQQIDRVLQHCLIFAGEPADRIRSRLIEMRIAAPGSL